MREQVDRLQKLTTDLLDLSRLDAGSLDLRAGAGPAAHAGEPVAGEFAAAAARKDRIEVADRDVQLDIEAVCDPERVAQIVRVLIDNALVHTPDGTRITIAAAPRGAGTAPGPPQLLVTDDGPGIRRRELAYVFDRFHTSDSASGSGLGPRDRPRAGAAHAGRARGRLRPGQHGFTLTLPLGGRARRRPRPARPRRAAAGRGGRVTRGARACWRSSRWRPAARRLRRRRGRRRAALDGRAHPRAGGRGPRAARTASTRRRSTSACRPAS